MCMCISMAIGFLSLGILQLSPGYIITEVCATTGKKTLIFKYYKGESNTVYKLHLHALVYRCT